MALIPFEGPVLTLQQGIIRILVAFVLSMIFGLERQFTKKPVGFGAFTFVAVGATTLIVVAELISEAPITIFAGIVTGIGFLGAGAILKSGDKKVTGITTAASLWVFASLGITIGLGQFGIAAVVYALIIVIIVIDHYFEGHGFGNYSKTVTLVVNEFAKLKDIERLLPKNHRTLIYNFDITKKEYAISFLLSGNKREINMTLNEILKQPGVATIKIE